MAKSPDKPEYFANGDFEDAVSSIIASPRRGRIINGLPSAVAARMYEMSDKQRDYYKKCFGQLMKAIQGSIDYESAVWGGDTNVVHFFRKSQLENEVLSRVWSMADVNADGWLDLAEFSVAMHLIVLHVKGGLEVPECLPTHLRPPLTCPRSPPPTPTWSHFDESSSSSTATVVHSHNPSSSVVSASFHAPPPHSQSAEALHLQQKIETPVPLHFSDVPPLLVDGRPTAIRTSQPIVTAPTPVNARPDTAALLLSLKTPMGPPPQPPPRPANRGHGRSASLDLKAMSTAVNPADRLSSHPCSTDSPDCPPSSSSSSAFRPMSSSLHATSAAAPAANGIPALPARPGRGAGSSLVQHPSAVQQQQQPPPPCASSPAGSSNSASSVASAAANPAPPPPTTTPPSVQPRRQCAATQTEDPYITREDVERFITDFVSRRDDLLGAALPSSLSTALEAGRSDVEKWAGRCEALRVQNAELERERATLAQVRIQLELRLAEMQLQPGRQQLPQQQQPLQPRNGCSSSSTASARPTNL